VSLILFAAAVSGLALCVARRLVPNNGDEVPQHLELVTVFGALAAPYALVLMLMLAVGPRILYPGMPAVLLGAVLGAAFGGIRVATPRRWLVPTLCRTL
jgi:hypothetical protein